MTTNTNYTPAEIFAAGPVVPVLVIKDLDSAVPLAKALIAGGIKVLEVTLRTPVALEVIRKIADEVPEAIIGAGTVTNAQQLKQVVEAGAKFAISPGLTEALLEMTRKGLGMTAITDPDGRLAGIFTDDDLRRMLDRDIDIRSATIAEVMITDPITIEPGHLAAEALQIMESRKINGLVVCDDQRRPLGAFNMQDLLRAGVV